MASEFETEEIDTGKRKGPSAVLLLAGLVALLVSAWALAGPSAWGRLPDLHLGWLVVVAAVVVGLGLVFSPGRR